MRTSQLAWATSFRCIATRLPRIEIFERVSDPADLDDVLAVEARTNSRLTELVGPLAQIPAGERVAGPGSAYVMASFVYRGQGRFGDGSYGVYYAAHELATAAAERAFRIARRARRTSDPPQIFEDRVVTATIRATVAVADSERNARQLLDPGDYSASWAFAKHVRAAHLQGVRYASVRRAGGTCVAIYRPRCMKHPQT
ncbi:MAG: RES family NAD+ phosphorylase, partial [Vulcanimicrobiaceae bacterium]